MNNKSQSEIITTGLIILLVLAAILIIWIVVQGTLKGSHISSNDTYYYNNADTFCQHYNMTYEGYNCKDTGICCIEFLNDKIAKYYSIANLNGRYYFKE